MFGFQVLAGPEMVVPWGSGMIVKRLHGPLGPFPSPAARFGVDLWRFFRPKN